MLISQFVGSVDEGQSQTQVNTQHVSQTDRQTDRQETQALSVQFNSIVFRRSFWEVFDISVFRTPLVYCSLLVESLYGQRQLADPFLPSTVYKY
jgi:hypothetical protein